MNRTIVALVSSLLLLGTVVYRLAENSPSDDSSNRSYEDPIVVFCAASNRAVIELIRNDYEKEFGRSVQVQYGPSQTLLSSIEVGGIGDLYLPADDSYLEIAAEKGLITTIIPLAKMNAVVAVRQGNPKGIKSLEDMVRADVRLVQAEPDVAAIGKLVREALQIDGQWTDVANATDAFRTTVIDVANDILVNAADCGFVYDVLLTTYPDLQAIKIPELNNVVSNVSIGLVASSKHPQLALHFARYMASRDRGLIHYENQGFMIDQKDRVQDSPKIMVDQGAMSQTVEGHSIATFEKLPRDWISIGY